MCPQLDGAFGGNSKKFSVYIRSLKITMYFAFCFSLFYFFSIILRHSLLLSLSLSLSLFLSLFSSQLGSMHSFIDQRLYPKNAIRNSHVDKYICIFLSIYAINNRLRVSILFTTYGKIKNNTIVLQAILSVSSSLCSSLNLVFNN